jgi:hypothetical protein
MQTELTPTIAEMSEGKNNNKMQTNIFSVKYGSMRIHQNNIRLYSSIHDENGRSIIASTDINDVVNYGLFYLLTTLIRKPKTDEELAESYTIKEYELTNDEIKEADITHHSAYRHFLAGRKSVGGEFHLTREELENLYNKSEGDIDLLIRLIKDFTPPIYPHTITVGYEDGKYYWETLKAEY